MAKAINQTILMGRLTRDPELKTTSSGKSITTFSIAVDRMSGDETDFFEITAWEKQADNVANYLSKGSKVLVQGRLQLDRWNDKDGNARNRVSVVANDVTFLDAKTQDNSKPMTQDYALNKAKDVVIEDIDDKPIDLTEIPF